MPRDRDSAFFGHPIGLMSLFFTEMFERFCYYGMRAFLVFYLAAPKELGGHGMFVIDGDHWKAAPHASAMVGIYGSTVYLLSLPGGWIADRFLGQRKAVIIGGIGITLGNLLLSLPGAGDFFFVALALMALGTGFLKPNASTIVGQLYKPGDVRRDAGFTIYYIGINIGATIAPIILSFIAGAGLASEGFRQFLVGHGINPNYCWNIAFAIITIGMALGVLQFTVSQRLLGDAGKLRPPPTDPKIVKRDHRILGAIIGALIFVVALVIITEASLDTVTNVMSVGFVVGSIVIFYGLYRLARDAQERRGILAMIPLYMGAIAFFGIFEQAPTTLNTFANELTRRDFLGFNIPAAFWQSVNGLFIVILAPVVAALWLKLARSNKEPSSVMKFSIGMAIMSLSFVVMLPALGATHAMPVSAGYLIGLYFFNTLAELCISPVGLSSMSKLAPPRLAGMVMGLWFFGTAIGVFLAGRAGEVSGKWGYGVLFKFLIISSLVASALLFVISPVIKKMMRKNDTATDIPVEKSEKAEPEPLPTARVVDKD